MKQQNTNLECRYEFGENNIVKDFRIKEVVENFQGSKITECKNCIKKDEQRKKIEKVLCDLTEENEILQQTVKIVKEDFRKLRDDSTYTENLLRTENQILRK